MAISIPLQTTNSPLSLHPPAPSNSSFSVLDNAGPRKLPWLLWAIAITHAGAVALFHLFSNYGARWLSEEWGAGPISGGLVSSLQPFLVMLVAPIAAILLDRGGAPPQSDTPGKLPRRQVQCAMLSSLTAGLILAILLCKPAASVVGPAPLLVPTSVDEPAARDKLLDAASEAACDGA